MLSGFSGELTVHFFVDVIKNEDTQLSTRATDFTDLKSALAYSMKSEATKTASKISRKARSIEIEDNTGEEKDEKFESLLTALEKIIGQACYWKEKRSPTKSERDLLEVL
ncbi:hypothetical protein AVEN_178389-1 [Araneus ventricosus]|uniref:Uncharacterized protein n=1 Tax=Araneus ventricosus TaxID=182803 RepID=A0A4Y2BCE8_ARAVE|nr:hypothetical protein AVEN_178389-1 [Araneus ventricosus]